MIECPTCKHREFVGTLYCSECGTRLVHVNPMPTKSISKEQMREEAKTTRPTPPGPELSSGAHIGLRVISTGEIISLIGRENFTLGRSIEGQAILPDVDLSRFDAYDFGLSRIHAELCIDQDETLIVDLESANGTIVNGKRILHGQPETIEHGDIIQLGRLRLQVISRIN
jgi:pSer/pThr/pTyr-binding forkhead associated (FHA) protein